MVIGLNPSTADEVEPDHTITKCVGFARRWGLGAYSMLNLFPFRSTNPLGLLQDDGRLKLAENDAAIDHTVLTATRVLLAWGKHAAKLKPTINARAEGKQLRPFRDSFATLWDTINGKKASVKRPVRVGHSV